MRALLQRVARAEVRVDDAPVGRIDDGLVVLLGVGTDDEGADADALAAKVAKLRIFADDEGRMNRSVLDVAGEALVVSQFTLFADARKGNRPSYVRAARPERADELYRRFCDALASHGVPLATGTFRASMHLELVNDGPVTIWLDGEDLGGRR